MVQLIGSILSFLLLLMPVYAKTNITVASQNKVLSSLTIEFTGLEAKKLFEYLEKIQKYSGAYVSEENGMSHTYLSSPVLHCQQTSYQAYDHIPDKDPRLYNCYIKLSQNGLAA
jgi:hypothetical protein